VLDHGPLSLLYAIDTRQPAENAKLLAAIVADARFERTDAAVLKQMLHMSALGYSVLASMPLDPEMHDNHLSPNLLELWRTILRQHYAAHPL
jgi:hypothetical protein